MTTQTLIRKLNKEVAGLRKDITEIKRTILAATSDPEGEYKKSFIKKMLIRRQSKGPFYRFTDQKSFLKHVRSEK